MSSNNSINSNNSNNSSSDSFNFVPKHPSSYLCQDYWQWRYQHEDSNEWCRSYLEFRKLIVNQISKHDRILVLGCGNSSLSHDLMKDGFISVTSMDFSLAVLQKMNRRVYDNEAIPILGNECRKSDVGEWVCCNMMRMPFRDGSFDVVIEKSTLDCLFTDCRDRITDEAKRRMYIVLKQVRRVLCQSNNSKFFSISYSDGFERLPYFSNYFQQVKYFQFGPNGCVYWLYIAQLNNQFNKSCSQNNSIKTNSRSQTQQQPPSETTKNNSLFYRAIMDINTQKQSTDNQSSIRNGNKSRIDEYKGQINCRNNQKQQLEKVFLEQSSNGFLQEFCRTSYSQCGDDRRWKNQNQKKFQSFFGGNQNKFQRLSCTQFEDRGSYRKIQSQIQNFQLENHQKNINYNFTNHNQYNQRNSIHDQCQDYQSRKKTHKQIEKFQLQRTSYNQREKDFQSWEHRY